MSNPTTADYVTMQARLAAKRRREWKGHIAQANELPAGHRAQAIRQPMKPKRP